MKSNQVESPFGSCTDLFPSAVSDRSRSRGRDTGYHSSGRGGAGNFHSALQNALPSADVQEFPWPRGRERAPVREARPTPVGAAASRSTGRGGSGNFNQSPSPADPSYSLRDREILRSHAAAEAERNVVRSSGRGGMGNIVASPSPGNSTSPASRSRSRSVNPISTPAEMHLSRVPPAYSPSPSRDRQSNAQVNGNVNGYVNGNANAYVNGNANAYANGNPNGYVNGTTNGHGPGGYASGR
ncbi:hypothetical protein B0H17DRAFT_349895 [Mycena rosella]|uniref:Uncharacterized protein n=1 Tax=Mycena rosella TaxID=1033263 RepID=A0AAD7CQI9_MYCRO|nr:hypothetical protein B0H17DRAFT_349895 [Mycena rosella]